MGDKKWQWEVLEDGRKQLHCGKDKNELFSVVWEPVARQAKGRSVHRTRVVAVCSICKEKIRVGLGAPGK